MSQTDDSITAMGDFNVCARYLLETGNPAMSFGIGPQITAPTASKDETGTGTGKWSAGIANVMFNFANPKLQWGDLLAWQASFTGDSDRNDVNTPPSSRSSLVSLGTVGTCDQQPPSTSSPNRSIP